MAIVIDSNPVAIRQAPTERLLLCYECTDKRGAPMLRFNETKSATLNLRVSPRFKKAVNLIAERENRSAVNALECLVIDYFDRKGLTEADLAPSPKRKMAEVADARR